MQPARARIAVFLEKILKEIWANSGGVRETQRLSCVWAKMPGSPQPKAPDRCQRSCTEPALNLFLPDELYWFHLEESLRPRPTAKVLIPQVGDCWPWWTLRLLLSDLRLRTVTDFESVLISLISDIII